MPVPKKQIKLTTVGARSGEPRMVTLYAWDDKEDLVLVGSWGGSAHDPAWIHNLRAHPRAIVKVALDVFEVGAREVTDPAERDRLWAIVVERFPTYATYQRRTKRRIPIFVLTPEPEAE
ncbi:MAG: nitroreductase family deazaflavin-dependent oxidoreductase [Candidatus Limnocylindria bacterium]